MVGRALAYVTREAREELLATIGDAIDELGGALGALGDAYEQLDERTGDALEEELFRPTQAAYGRAKRTYTGFAGRHGLTGGRTFEPVSPGAASRGVRAFVDIAVEAIEEADMILAELQDSMRPVEVGDAELRAGLAEVRELLGALPDRARRLISRFGR
jgi:hypothetical protein